MSYDRPQRTLSAGRWRGPARGMGDTAPTMTPVEALIHQVNRFGPTAPAQYRFADRAFPVVASGKIAPDVAMAALLIYQRRAADAYNQFHDAGSEAAISRANQGFADPVAFVTGNLADVTTAITGFADSLGFPPATSPGQGGGGGFSTQTILMVAGGAVLLWLVTR